MTELTFSFLFSIDFNITKRVEYSKFMKSYDFKTLPIMPGIYQFTDEAGNILYIGKAKSLRNRLKSYFAKEVGRGPAIDLMIDLAKEIKWIETESEIEAILLEADLINKLKPKYNIRLRDDKSFLVIKITKPISINSEKLLCHPRAGNAMTRGSKIVNLSVDSRLRGNDKIGGGNDKLRGGYDSLFSCFELVRFKNVDLLDKSAWYFGPYPSGLLLKKSINYLRKIFPFRDCSKTKFSAYRRKGRPCIYGDIRVCTAPCVDWVNQKQYQKNIQFLINFLRGEKKNIYKKLKDEMLQLSQERRFEEAALVRDRLNALDHLKDIAIGLRDDVFNGGNSIFRRIECYDISNISGQYGVGAMVVFEKGKKSTDDYRKFKINFTQTPNDLLMMKEMLVRRFNNDWPLPDLIVIDGGETHLKVAKEVLDSVKLDIPVMSIAKGPTRKKNEFHFGNQSIAKYFMGNQSLENIVIAARDEAHRFAISYYRSLHKKGLFE